MKDEGKTKEQLIRELAGLRQRVVEAELEAAATPEKRVEEALRESEDDYRQLAESITDVFFALDHDLRYTYWNKASKSLTGIRAEDALGKSLLEVFPQTPWLRRAEKVYRNVLRTQRSQSFVDEVDLGGRRYVFEVNAYPSTSGVSVFVKDVTERNQTEETLRYQATLLGSVSDAVITTDLDFTIQSWNSAAEALYGWSAEEAIGKPMVQVVPTKYLNDSREAVMAQFRAEGVWRGEVIQKHRGGRDIHVSASVTLVRDDDGRPFSVLAINRDITERKRAEETLAEERNLLRTLIDALPDYIFVKDTEGRMVLVNLAQVAMFGKTDPDEVIGKTDLDLAPAEFAEQYHRHDLTVMESGEPLHVEEPYRGPEGELRWASSIKVPLRDVHGDVTGVVGMSRDVTDRKRAAEALAAERNLLRTMIDALPDHIYVKDTEGRLLVVNVAQARFLGSTDPEDVVGKTAFDVRRAELAEQYNQNDMRVIQSGQPLQVEELFVTPAGEERLGWSIKVPLRDVHGEIIGLVGMTRDITDRKRMEEALRRTLDETIRGRRMLQALNEAAQAVQRARTAEEVYRTLGDEVVRLGYHCLIFALADDGAHLTIAYQTLAPDVLRAAKKLTGLSVQTFRVPLAQAPNFQRSLTEGETSFHEPTAEYMAGGLPKRLRPLAGRLAALLGLEQSITAPLKVGGEMHGLMMVTGAGLTEGDVAAVTAFANQASIALENARLLEAEHAASERLRDLANYLQQAREEERTHIARGIHDDLGQALTALKMDLSWLAKRLPGDEPSLAEKASAMSGLIDDTIQTVRLVATELRPGLLDDLGLAAAIEWEVQRFAERTEIDCELFISGEEIALERDLATAAFRVLQETLTNVARHAEASEVRVELEVRPDELALVIRDNGKGITESQVSNPRSLGLIGIRERARSWGGDVTFEGLPGQGTTVTLRMARPNPEGSQT